jgi:uncharacterized protein YoxC
MKKEKMEKKLRKLSALVCDLEDKLYNHSDILHHTARENAELRAKVQQLEERLDGKVSKVDFEVFEHNTAENLNALMERKADKSDVEGLMFLIDKTRKGLEVSISNCVSKDVLDDSIGSVSDRFMKMQKELLTLEHKVDSLYNADGLTQIGSGVGKATTINGGQINCNKTTNASLGITQKMEDAGVLKVRGDEGIMVSNQPPIAPEGQEYVQVSGRGWVLHNKPNPSLQSDVPNGFKLLNIVYGKMHIKSEVNGNEYMIPYVDVPEGKELVQTSIGWELRDKPTQWQVAPEDVQGWKTTTDYAKQFLDRADGKFFDTTEEKAQAEKLAESVKWITDLNKKYADNIGGGFNLNGLALHSSRIMLDMMNRMDNTVHHLEKLQRNFDDEIGKMNAVEYPADDLVEMLNGLAPEDIVANNSETMVDPLDEIHKRLDVLEKLICQKAELIDVNEALRLLKKTDENVKELKVKTNFVEGCLNTVNKNQDKLVDSINSLNTKREVDQERFDLLEEENNTLTRQWRELTEGVSRISIDINEKVDAVNVWVNNANQKITSVHKYLDELNDKVKDNASSVDDVMKRVTKIESILNMQILPALGVPAIMSESPVGSKTLSDVPFITNKNKE